MNIIIKTNLFNSLHAINLMLVIACLYTIMSNKEVKYVCLLYVEGNLLKY